jgi:hypothetical protein
MDRVLSAVLPPSCDRLPLPGLRASVSAAHPAAKKGTPYHYHSGLDFPESESSYACV